MNRRVFLGSMAAATCALEDGVAFAAGPNKLPVHKSGCQLADGVCNSKEDIMAYTLPPLPYPAEALEPSIDKMTMEIHHGRHHKTYVDNLNKALEGQAGLGDKPIEQLLRDINSVPQNIRQAVINNGGGHANHSMFWQIMGPKAGGKPSGPLADAINLAFGDFGGLQNQLKQAALTRFGSGWGWLVHGDG